MKWKVVRIISVLLLLSLPFVAWRLWLTYEVNQQFAAVRAEGLPVNGEELNLVFTVER